MVFITSAWAAHGTGASPIVARVAKEVGALTIGVVTRPLRSRAQAQQGGRIRHRQAQGSGGYTDRDPNDRLLEIVTSAPASNSVPRADDVLRQGIQGISELITVPA